MKLRFIPISLMATITPASFAELPITLYGVADAGVVYESGGDKGDVSAISSGIASGNRIGFKGREDIGDGITAFFQLESGFNIDDGESGQSGRLFGREALLGLTGKLGTLSLGRQYSPYYKAIRDIADPFGAGLAGNALNIMAGDVRVDDMAEYQSPTFKGWSVDLAYGAGEVEGNSEANRTLGAALTFTQGRFNAHLAHHRQENATASDHFDNTLLVVKFNFAFATPSIAYANNRGLAGADSTDTLLGVTVPLGKHKVMASVIVHSDDTTAEHDAQQWALGYLYSFSKRIDFYSAYGNINNDNGANFKVGNATDLGSGNSAFNLGARYTF